MASKKPPIDGIQFNVLAVVLALVILPGAVAFLTSSGGYKDPNKNWEPMFEKDYPSSTTYANWVENGDDYSIFYDSDTTGDGYCAYLEAFVVYYPQCSGTGTGTSGSTETDWLSAPGIRTGVDGNSYISMPKSHTPLSGTYYHTTSGDGPFSWAYSSPTTTFAADEMVSSFRWLMIDSLADYPCDSNVFVNFSYDMSVYFFDFNLLGTGGIWFNQTIEEASNKVEWWIVGSSGELEAACFIGLDVVLDLDVFNQFKLNDYVQGNWTDTVTVLRLDDFSVETVPGLGLGGTEMPFLGGGASGNNFLISYSYSSTNEAEASFYVKGGTFVLAFAVLAVGLASTPYWDPFRSLFRGRF